VFNGAPDAVVDMAARNTWQLPLGDGPIDLASRIGALRADLAGHFETPLTGHEGPTILMYQPGGFYEPHVDRAGDDEVQIALSRRRVTVVIFLNAMSTQPGPGDYSGGALTFYGLLDDPAWRKFGFALDPMPGLLVAFPSHIVHEVTPVTAGDRYTIVDWFTI
jgi:predicted 2-oxoglutarate/Fe(II)-dependent dioxygenase YbiX